MLTGSHVMLTAN